MTLDSAWILLAGVLIAGCDDSAGGLTGDAGLLDAPIVDGSLAADAAGLADAGLADAAAPRFPNQCPEEACAEPLAVVSDTEIFAILAAEQWMVVAGYSPGCQPVSQDILVTADVTLRAADVPLDPGFDDTRDVATFQLIQSPAGVTCLEPDPIEWLGACATVKIAAGSTIRLRAIHLDRHPVINYVPIIRIIPPCTKPCADGLFTCAANHTCFESVGEHCLLCLAGDPKVCACWDGSDLLPDQAECHYMVSGDMACSGQCVAGTCVSTGSYCE